MPRISFRRQNQIEHGRYNKKICNSGKWIAMFKYVPGHDHGVLSKKQKVKRVWFRRNETKVCQKASIVGMAIYKGYHLSKIMNKSINHGPESLELSSNTQHPEQRGVKFGKYYHSKYIANDISRSCIKIQRKQRGQKSLERKEILTPLQRKTDRR